MKKIFLSVIGIVIAIILVLIPTFIFISDHFNNVSYVDRIGWSCTNQEFESVYIKKYNEKASELKLKYKIDCSESLEIYEAETDKLAEMYLYNENFTIKIFFANRGGLYGDFKIDLYVFDTENSEDLNCFSNQSKLVCFINDFANYVAFDTLTEEDVFEELFYEAREKEDVTSQIAARELHFDDLVGTVGYSVGLNRKSCGYYYLMQKDSSIKLDANVYTFEGVLAPIDFPRGPKISRSSIFRATVTPAH